jgi:hypothetical protein
MLKKILLGTLLIGFIGVLIFGAIYRTNAITSKETGSREVGKRQESSPNGNQTTKNGNGTGNSRAGSNQIKTDQGLSTGSGSVQEEPKEWVNVDGTVTDLESGILKIATENGNMLEIADRPWRFAQEQGFTTAVNHRIAVKGFYEEGNELEVGKIIDLSTGDSVTIREENGRPLWAVRGRGG